MPNSDTIALIFDYDDTLVPDSTTQFLKKKGIDAKKFWKEDWKKLVCSGYDATHAFLKLFLGYIGEDKPFGKLTNANLFEFGREVQRTQYPGLPKLLKKLRETVHKAHKNIEFYVVSGGLEEIIKGNSFIRENFTAIYGCRLAGDIETSEIKYIKRAITFTEKTKYLFEINKGISQEDADENPSAVNKDVKKGGRRIPFDNMIYVGDGLTDIPCFSLVRNENNHGIPLGIFHKEKDMSEKLKIFDELLRTNRTLGAYYPEYGEGKQLGEKITLAVMSLLVQMDVKTGK